MKQQLYQIVDSVPYPLFVTRDAEGFAVARPMYLAAREENVFWFPASVQSEKISRIRSDSRSTLLFVREAQFDYASVYGTASIVTSKERKRRLWHAEWLEQWPAGAEDDDYILLRVEGCRADYYRGIADEREQLTLP